MARAMTTLPMIHRLQLKIAAAWLLDMDNPLQAAAELATLDHAFHDHPHVVALRQRIRDTALARWQRCLRLALRHMALNRGDPLGPLYAAFCLRHLG